jgi:aspartyl/asparaginyl beta-hydroxylase (cupin superfamily)
MSPDPAGLIKEADAALAAGRLDEAAKLLEQATAAGESDPAIWMRLAAVHRAGGRPKRALEAVDRALVHGPLDFMALLMRASLLDRLSDPSAGEAWNNALAQAPEGELPPQVEAAVAQGQARREAWIAGREAALQSAMAPAEARAGDEERKRIARFRTNVLRKTKPYRSSPTHFHYPELSEREFHPRASFPWLDELEAATETIAAELTAVMNAERAELVPYIQYADHLPLDQWRPLNRNPDWTAIHLLNRGERVEANVRHCPETMRLLAGLPQPDIRGAGPNAMFSLLAPETEIPPHVGVNNCRLVCHLPLIVPPGCWFRVGAETRHWERGQAFVFDDTIEHEAANPSGELRVVFIFDVWHPDLSPVEREAVKSLIEADPGARAQIL